MSLPSAPATFAITVRRAGAAVAARPEGAAKRVLERTPPRRIGQPEDIADVGGFRVSDAGRCRTGQALSAGGGMF